MWFIHFNNILEDISLFVNGKSNWKMIHEKKALILCSIPMIINILYIHNIYVGGCVQRIWNFIIHQHFACVRRFLFICNIFTIYSVCLCVVCTKWRIFWLLFGFICLWNTLRCSFEMGMDGKRQTDRQSKYKWERMHWEKAEWVFFMIVIRFLIFFFFCFQMTS